MEHEALAVLALQRIDDLWKDGLLRFGGPFLAGSRFSAVDAFFAPVTTRLQTYGLTLSDASAAYAARVLDHLGVPQSIAPRWGGDEAE